MLLQSHPTQLALIGLAELASLAIEAPICNNFIAVQRSGSRD